MHPSPSKWACSIYIQNFYVENSGKLYRSCGNFKSKYQGQRKVEISNTQAKSVSIFAGININYKDIAKFTNVSYWGGVCLL